MVSVAVIAKTMEVGHPILIISPEPTPVRMTLAEREEEEEEEEEEEKKDERERESTVPLKRERVFQDKGLC